jgi:ABC-type phosphate/phosphonate transport system substrate-binding protein
MQSFGSKVIIFIHTNLREGLAITLAWMLLFVSLAWSGDAKGPVAETSIRFGITTGVLEADVNQDDALAATKVWAAALGAGTGTWTKSDARIFHDLPSLVASVKNAEMDVIALSTKEYLEVEGSLRAEPAFTYVQSGQVELEYVILARHDSGLKTPADLRGKRIATVKGGRNSIMPLWLDVLLSDNGLPAKESFFREIKETVKASQAILPVFFKQIEAGVVTKSAFDTAVTLNPQIGQQIKVLAASPRLVPMVTCLRVSLPAEQKAIYLREALRLHENPNGLQTFNIFKLERLVRWEPRYLNTVKELISKQKLSRSVRPGNLRSNPPSF